MKSIVILIFLTIITVNSVKSQNDYSRYNLIEVPASPNASALSKFSNIPVNLSTGVPTISIPIFNLEKGGIQLPIELNYHASGIRVEQESSNVGLGWSLPLGGIISRTTRSLPDDDHNGYINNCEKMINEEVVDFNLNNSLTSNIAYYLLEEISRNIKDYEPDLFSFNINGNSGSFMFNNHGEITLMPFQDILFKPIFYQNKLVGFSVIDPNGIVYFYGDTIQQTNVPSEYIETTSQITASGIYGPYNSAWVINEIVNPLTKQHIKFHYVNTYKRTTLSYKSGRLYEREVVQPPLYFWKEIETFNGVDITNYNYCQINNIIIDNDTVFFESSLAQEGIKKIDKIKFKGQNCNLYYKESSERTFLDSIVINSPNHSTLKSKYELQYSDINLPEKDSYQIDYWGYYNHRYNGYSSTIPLIEYNSENFGDANREPDPDYSIAGSLKKITYPTGGSTEFVFQNNTYARFKTVEEVSHPVVSLDVIAEATENTIYADTNIMAIDWANYTNKHDFTLIASFDIPNDFPLKHMGHVQVLDSNNTIVWQHSFNELSDSLYISWKLDLDTNNIYRIRVVSRFLGTLTWAHFEFKWYESKDLLQKKDVLGGGLRIYQIKSKSSDNAIEEIKTYDYSLSGYLTALPPVYYTVQTVKRMNSSLVNPGIEVIQRLLVYARPVGGLANSVAYNKVIQYDGTYDNNMGKIVTYFDEIPDEPSGVEYAPDENCSNLRTIPRRIDYFSESNKKIKSENMEYEYDSNHYTVIKAFRTSRIMTVEVPMSIVDYPYCFDFGNYYIRSFYLRLKQSTNTFYFGNDSVSDQITYYYENDKHLNPTRITKLNSLNQIETTVNRYPADFIPSFEPCEINYQQEISNCNLLGLQCATDYNSCLDKFQECNEASQGALSKPWVDLLAFVLTFGQSVYVDMDQIQLSIAIHQQCISTPGGYTDCVNNLDCGHLACISGAEFHFDSCSVANYISVINEYQTTSDPSLKAIILLYLHNRKNEVIETIKSIDGTITIHNKNNYKLFSEDGINYTPLLIGTNNLMVHNFQNDFTINKFTKANNPVDVIYRGDNKITFQWGYGDKYLIAKTVNSSFCEAGYTGFENKELNDWTKYPRNLFDDHEFFTGASSISVVDSSCGPTRDFKVGMQAANHNGYQASVWVKGSKYAYLHIEANGWSIHERTRNDEGSDDWHLLKVILYRHQYESVIDSTLKIRVYVGVEGEELAHFDDLRFYPLDAQMTTYTYIPFIGISSISDNNNKPNRYEYDSFGRLTHIRDFQDNILKKYDYHYKP